MDYEITRIKNGETVAVEMTEGLPFETIKNDARNWLELDLADRVEVRDMNGQLVHQHPRVTRAAHP